MSVVIKNLTRIFGKQVAVDNVSFSANKSEILGFLGPNGAGKSTTMKIAAGYLAPSAGTVEIAGFDIATYSLNARGKTGYLPENNPLYPDLYVKEYLHFVGKVHHLRNVDARVNDMIKITGLEDEKNKRIGQLSKGYRQRVGLAQTLIHDPEVLIMDEPTSGLDPNQIIEIRQLIKTVSQDKTVILSTHIMQEVQALCDRVIIINKGRIVADSPIGELLSYTKDEQIIRIEFSAKSDPRLFTSIRGFIKLETDGEKAIRITVKKDSDARAEIFRIAATNNLPVTGLTQEENSMESIFKEITNPKN
jgi:ABC-2 type transport system ATP-binding protein